MTQAHLYLFLLCRLLSVRCTWIKLSARQRNAWDVHLHLCHGLSWLAAFVKSFISFSIKLYFSFFKKRCFFSELRLVCDSRYASFDIGPPSRRPYVIHCTVRSPWTSSILGRLATPFPSRLHVSWIYHRLPGSPLPPTNWFTWHDLQVSEH